jgi:hypothetical protein
VVVDRTKVMPPGIDPAFASLIILNIYPLLRVNKSTPQMQPTGKKLCGKMVKLLERVISAVDKPVS